MSQKMSLVLSRGVSYGKCFRNPETWSWGLGLSLRTSHPQELKGGRQRACPQVEAVCVLLP